MVLTRSFKDFVKARAESDPAFRQALLQEAVQTLISELPELLTVTPHYLPEFLSGSGGASRRRLQRIA
jgi:hypothetical protein